jgi:hypothetical protein
MADHDQEVKRLLEEARRARDEADRLRREARAEAERLKAAARRAREDARRERHAARSRQSHADDDHEAPPAARAERPIPPLEGVRNLEIDNTAGRLTVRACLEGETPAVIAAASKTAPEIDIQRDGDTLRIHIRVARGWLFRRRQGATSLVRLPPHPLRSLRIANGYGEVEATSLAAESIRLSCGAGSITAVQLTGDLETSVGAGKISILAHDGTAAAHSGTGDITLDLATLRPGAYRVDVGLGRAEVRVPAGAPVEIRANSGLGKASLAVPSVPGAPALLKVNSGIGEVSVRPRTPGEAPEPARPARAPGPARAADRRREAEELRVLQLLEQGRITPQDAADLIAALRGTPRPAVDDTASES